MSSVLLRTVTLLVLSNVFMTWRETVRSPAS
jgi:uncharacterized protein (DUF486 family)